MKLVKLSSDHYIIVDEGKQPVEGFYYDNFIKDIRKTNGAEYGQADHCWQITHSTQPVTNEVGNDGFEFDHNSTYPPTTILPLSLSEVKEVIGEVDVEKKAEEVFPYKETRTDFATDECRIIYKTGYNQALEDNKGKVYTEEDVRKAMDLYKNTSIPLNDIIQSIQPKTEWDVKFDDRGKLKLS